MLSFPNSICLNSKFPAPGTIFQNNHDIEPREAREDAEIVEGSAGGDLVVFWKFDYVSTMWLAKQAEVEIPKFAATAKQRALSSHFIDDETSLDLIESIKREGFYSPIMLYGNIIEGYHRLYAALYLGLSCVPCIYAIHADTGERVEQAKLWPRDTPAPSVEEMYGRVA